VAVLARLDGRAVRQVPSEATVHDHTAVGELALEPFAVGALDGAHLVLVHLVGVRRVQGVERVAAVELLRIGGVADIVAVAAQRRLLVKRRLEPVVEAEAPQIEGAAAAVVRIDDVLPAVRVGRRQVPVNVQIAENALVHAGALPLDVHRAHEPVAEVARDALEVGGLMQKPGAVGGLGPPAEPRCR
jgi:hypothetical protein